MFTTYPDVLNVEELCQALGIGKNICYKLLNSGDIKSLRIGKTWKIPKAYLIQYIQNAA